MNLKPKNRFSQNGSSHQVVEHGTNIRVDATSRENPKVYIKHTTNVLVCNASWKSRRLYKTYCLCSGMHSLVPQTLNQTYGSSLEELPAFLESDSLLQYSHRMSYNVDYYMPVIIAFRTVQPLLLLSPCIRLLSSRDMTPIPVTPPFYCHLFHSLGVASFMN